MNNFILSVLVCTVPSRLRTTLPVLIEELEKQAEGKPVEILYMGDNKKRPVGAKRNDLILMAQGKYACFVDDDDRIESDYIDSILEAAKHNSDCITFKAFRYENGKPDKEVLYSKDYGKDANAVNVYYRIPNHLMPIKTSILLKAFFKEISYGEDADFARQVLPLIQTESKINKVLYYYDFDSRLSETAK